jgi:hypothetical protein
VWGLTLAQAHVGVGGQLARAACHLGLQVVPAWGGVHAGGDEAVAVSLVANQRRLGVVVGGAAAALETLELVCRWMRASCYALIIQ